MKVLEVEWRWSGRDGVAAMRGEWMKRVIVIVLLWYTKKMNKCSGSIIFK